MSGWFEATLLSTQRAAENLSRVHLSVEGGLWSQTHHAPGQYVRVVIPEFGEAYFAIASAPYAHPEHLELLVKGGTPLSDALIGLAPGSKVSVGMPEGFGFPLDKARGKNLLLFATGSGIGAIRSVIERVRVERALYGEIVLYFGARTPNAFAYEDELETWREADIRTILTISQPGESGWSGLTGYVQNHVGEQSIENAVAFVCGQPDMVHGVTEALVARGLPATDIFLNF